MVNQGLNAHILCHLATSAHVFVFNWFSVLAVTTPRVSSFVDIAQRIIHATKADLPMPWPDAIASRIASCIVIEPFLSLSPILCNALRCHSRMLRPFSSPSPQGNAVSTYNNGSCSHSSANATSSSSRSNSIALFSCSS